MRPCVIAVLTFLALLSTASRARADEIRLKDGSKIYGTIVGFENDSFRVETSYGFALVQKDKVADISITAPKKETEPKTKLSAPASPPPPEPDAPSPWSRAPAGSTTTEVRPAVVKEPDSAGKLRPEANAPAKDRPRNAGGATPAGAKINPAPSRTAAAAAEAPELKPVSATAPAPPPPEPPVIRDEIRGNLYTNLTFGFEMYKPPSWDLIPDARKALPDAIAAMGTYDQTTLLVIGRVPTKDSLEAHAAATGKALSSVYDNYRLLSNEHVTINGFPAIEQHARGTAGGHDWAVELLTLMKGNEAFTLLGMTWSDSDLIQVQENVIAKSINSLKFTAR
ncbi:MAG: hypothetical protein ACRD4Y_01015 [Candidatus Acidiferrales bacterium]